MVSVHFRPLKRMKVVSNILPERSPGLKISGYDKNDNNRIQLQIKQIRRRKTHNQRHDQSHAEIDQYLNEHIENILDQGFLFAHGSHSHEPA